MVETAKPPQDKLKEELVPQDYQVLKVDLGKSSRAMNIKIFEVSYKNISKWAWKDAKDKKNMKEAMGSMAQYINAIL